MEFEDRKNRQKNPRPSRLMIYWLERQLEGTINIDAGAMIRDGLKSVNQFGAAPEELWPYDIAKFTRRPSVAAFTAAKSNQVIQYGRVPIDPLQFSLALADGVPVVFGFTVYESFMSTPVTKTGVLPMPGRNERVVGGHAVLAVGYDTAKKLLIVRNSWGSRWGAGGNFLMPFAYITPELADDAWQITRVE